MSRGIFERLLDSIESLTLGYISQFLVQACTLNSQTGMYNQYKRVREISTSLDLPTQVVGTSWGCIIFSFEGLCHETR